MLWLTRLYATLATLRYPAAWVLPPRLARPLRQSLRHLRPVVSPVGIVLHPYAPPIGSRAFGRYLHGLGRLARGERVPLVVHLSVTDRCGNACPRCSNFARSRQDPPLEDLATLIEGLRQAGTVSIALTGGEPMLRPDLPEIIAACGPELAVTLFTSGAGLGDTEAARLRAAGLAMAFISLDHARPEVHDRQRGAAGVHAQAVRALRACRAAGIYTAAQAVADDELLAPGELERYLAFCAGLGVHEIMLLEPVAVRPGHSCPSIPPETRQRLIDLHKQSARDASRPKVSSASFLESPEFLGCQAGYSFIYVSAAGDVFPCDFAPITLGNVYQEPLSAILECVDSCFPTPSCRCLAEVVRQACGAGAGRPVALEQAGEFLNDVEGGHLPRMMQWLRSENDGGVDKPEEPL